MAVSIKVQYSRSPIDVVPPPQSYDLNVKVLEATDMPKEIFVLQRGLAVPNTPPAPNIPAEDTFICLADPVDLEEFPVGAPNLAREMPYFRVAEITLRFRAMEILEETLELLDDDIGQLVDALKVASTLAVISERTHD